MSQRIVRPLLAAGAIAAVLATGPAQAREGPREAAGKVWRWLAGLQENVHLALRLWPGEPARGKQGHLIDPDGSPAPNPAGSTTPSCEGCTEAGLLIDPNG